MPERISVDEERFRQISQTLSLMAIKASRCMVFDRRNLWNTSISEAYTMKRHLLEVMEILDQIAPPAKGGG